MQLNNKRLTDEFEINALWTIEGYDIQGVVGTLSHTQNKILLDLPNIDNLNLSEKVYRALGETRTKIVSLFNLRVVSMYSNTLSHTKLLADYMIIDTKPINKLEELKLKSVTFSFDYLPLLFNKSNWKSKRKTNNINYKQINSKSYDIKDLNAVLTEEYGNQSKSSITSIDGHVITLKTHPYLKIEYAEKQSVLKIKKDILKIRNLLTILSGEALTLTSFSFDSKGLDITGNAMPVKGEVFFSQLNVKREYKQFTSAYKYDDIINKFPVLLTNYFKYYSKLQPIAKNIAVNTAIKNLAETQFHDAITSLEVYHREFYKKYEDTTPEKEITKQQILEIIEKNHEDNAERNELKEILKSIDRVNLTKRVKQLFRDLPTDLRKEIVYHDLDFSKNKVINDFAYQCSSTRNYHAHGSTNPKNNIFMSTDLIYVSKILNLVSEYYLMKQIGLDEEVIVEGIKNKKDYQVILEQPYAFESPN